MHRRISPSLCSQPYISFFGCWEVEKLVAQTAALASGWLVWSPLPPCGSSPGVPWWHVILVLVAVPSSLILHFLFWSVLICCQTEQSRVIISAASHLVLCRCVSAFTLKWFQAFLCFPAPLSLLLLVHVLWHGSLPAMGPVHLSAPLRLMSVILHPWFSSEARLFPCLCQGSQLLFQLLVPSIPHGEDLLSFKCLLASY